MAGRKRKKLTARVTFLEMRHRPKRHFPQPTRPRLALMRAQNMPVAFYRYLYEQVGRDYHWYLRRVMADVELENIIQSDNTQIDVLYADGCPAGFFELDLSNLPASVEIAYFGLMEHAAGQGLGRWFLGAAIEAAWEHNPAKVVLQTCTLDHPAALPLYQKMGFSPVGQARETLTPLSKAERAAVVMR